MCFFAGFVESAVEVAGFDEEEEEEEEDDEEEVDVLGKVGINLAFGINLQQLLMTLRVDVGYVCTVIVRRRKVETCGDEMAKSPTTCAKRSFKFVRLV